MGMIEMTNQTVEIADLIQPKFKPRDEVFLADFDHNGRLQSIRRVMVDEVRFTVRFYAGSYSGRYTQEREATLVYDLLNNGQAFESRLFATAEEAARAAK